MSRASAQNLMKAIGDVQAVGGSHFVDRASLLCFLDEMVAADSVDKALRSKYDKAEPVSRPKTLHLHLPEDLRRVTLKDLPERVALKTGEIRVTGVSAEHVLQSLLLLAQVMQNDLESVRARLDPPAPQQTAEDELSSLFASLGVQD